MNGLSKAEKTHMAMAFCGNSIFGFSFLFSKLAMGVAEPFVLLAVRFLVAFILMTVLMFAGVVKCDLKGKDLKPLILLGILQPVIYFICESYGIKYSSSSFAGIMIALIPIAGVLFGFIMLGEKPTLAQVIFSVISVGGVIVMTTTGGMGGFQMKGLVILLGAVFSGAMFSTWSRKIADQFTAFERTYVMFGIGSIVFVSWAIIKAGTNTALWITPFTSVKFWASIIYLSCVSSIGAFLLLNKALDVLDVARSLVFANVTTVISVVAGVVFLKESFSAIQIVGIVLVIVGVYGVNRPQK